MAEDETPEQEPEEDQVDEDEEAKRRLDPWLRSLIRSELEEHHKRVQPPEDEKPKDDKSKPAKEEEKPKDGDSGTPARPRRSAADVWFGRRS